MNIFPIFLFDIYFVFDEIVKVEELQDIYCCQSLWTKKIYDIW